MSFVEDYNARFGKGLPYPMVHGEWVRHTREEELGVWLESNSSTTSSIDGCLPLLEGTGVTL